jgi:FtsP/CotA-like multicopper oxidase with cupredoxin domain
MTLCALRKHRNGCSECVSEQTRNQSSSPIYPLLFPTMKGWAGICLAAAYIPHLLGAVQQTGADTVNAAETLPELALRSICSIPAAGSEFSEPAHYLSSNGVLETTLHYFGVTELNGGITFCYASPAGDRSPTLHLNPGDTLLLTVVNRLPLGLVNDTSTDVHFHGLFVSPVAPSDDVLHVRIRAGESYTYRIAIPKDHPSGLYWYHPHVHGNADANVLGGASGALIVDGLEREFPTLADMPYQTIVVRGGNLPARTPAAAATDDADEPTWDLSVGFTPIGYLPYAPVIMTVDGAHPETRLWRVCNAHADIILEIRLDFDGVAQPLLVVAMDGVASGGADDARHVRRAITLGPGNRAELVITTPSLSAAVKNAALVTLFVDTGPDGDSVPFRPLVAFNIVSTEGAGSQAATKVRTRMPSLPVGFILPQTSRESRLHSAGYLDAAVKPNAIRTLEFSEVPNEDSSLDPTFYITVVTSILAALCVG